MASTHSTCASLAAQERAELINRTSHYGPGKEGDMGASVLLSKYDTADLGMNVVTFVEENGDLVLVGYDRDKESEHEWEARVGKEQKEALLLLLVKQCFHSDVTFRSFCSWLDAARVPYKLTETTDIDPSGP
jgi:hypothetical protein